MQSYTEPEEPKKVQTQEPVAPPDVLITKPYTAQKAPVAAISPKQIEFAQDLMNYLTE